MPTVPVYSTSQVNPSQMPAPYAQENSRIVRGMTDSADAALDVGRALQGFGNEMTREKIAAQNQANQIQHVDYTNFAKQAGMDQTVQYTQLQGKDAMVQKDDNGAPVNPVDTYAQKLKDALYAHADTLGNEVQKQTARQTADAIVNDFHINATQHQAREYKNYQTNVNNTTIDTATKQMALFPLQPDKTQESIAGIRSAIAANLQGQDQSVIDEQTNKAISTAHTTAIETLLDQRDIGNAQRYFNTYKNQMDPLQAGKVQKALEGAQAGNAAIGAVDNVWSQLGPKDYNGPVDMFAMEKKVRDLFPNNEQARNAAMAELSHRAAGFEYSARQYDASNVNAVMKNVSSGMSSADVMQMPEFQALPGEKQEQINTHLRAITSGKQRDLEQDNYSTYQDIVSNPDQLAQMSNEEVQALTPQIGDRLTNKLIDARNRLNTAAGKASAKIDIDDFNTNVRSMGLDPTPTNKTDKAYIGMINDRVNTLLFQAQAEAKRPLTNEERNTIMKQEIARTVTIPRFFGADQQVPVIALKPEQLDDIQVPDAERGKITEALQSMYKANPTNSSFAPTEQNVRALYLKKVSRAGGLIRGK